MNFAELFFLKKKKEFGLRMKSYSLEFQLDIVHEEDIHLSSFGRNTILMLIV